MGMVDISDKAVSHRTAVAEGRMILSSKASRAIREGEIAKGDPLRTAEASALLSIKQTHLLIPHCHPIPLSKAEVVFYWEGGEPEGGRSEGISDGTQDGVADGVSDDLICRCTVEADYTTGVEMEALTGVSIALLTVWDMVKYLEKDDRGQYPGTAIHGMRVVSKEKRPV